MTALVERFRDNPIFVKEMRIGFREKKVFYALSAWVLLIALIAAFSAANALGSNSSISELPEAGHLLFEVLFWAQLVLLCLIAPSLTTSSVSGERERKSFDMLVTTQLSPAELVFGKFGFAFSFILLALAATLPFEAVVFVLGGVSLSSFLIAKASLATAGALACLLGLTMSARESRSAYATGATYLCLMVLFFFLAPFIAVLRYLEDVPWFLYIGVALLALYSALFLFWKAVQHFEERAFHLKIILGLTLGFYLVLLGLSLTDDTLWSSVGSSFWPAFGPVHYLLYGLLLNPMRPERSRERELFQRSLLARPIFWAVVLTSGLFTPALMYQDPDFTVLSTYVAFTGLATALWARGISTEHPRRYPFALGFSWAAFNLLPLFISLFGLGTGEISVSPIFLSPLAYGSYSLNSHSGVEVAVLALACYAVLGIVGALLERRRGSARASKQ